MTTKKETKRLTITDILKEKEKYSVDKQETKDVTISRLNAEVLIRKPEKSLCMETFQMNRDEDTADSADAYMVYNTMVEPNLKDTALQAEFGVREPLEIVDKIFEPGEVAQLAEFAMEMAGFKKGVVAVKTAKKLIESDDDFYFLHHYLKKGFTIDYLLNLRYDEKLIMMASLDRELEEMKAMGGANS